MFFSQFLFCIFPPTLFIQLLGFLFFSFLNTILLLSCPFVSIFTFTPNPWNTRKKNDFRDTFVSSQSILTCCCPFDWQILTTLWLLCSLTLSEPRMSPSRRFFVLLMHCYSYWAQLCEKLQHQRQVYIVYYVCVGVGGVEIWFCAWEGEGVLKASVLGHKTLFPLGYHLSSNSIFSILSFTYSSPTSLLSSPHPPEEQQDSLSLTTNISLPSYATCSLSRSQHGTYMRTHKKKMSLYKDSTASKRTHDLPSESYGCI